MREIKFRAWSESKKAMYRVLGYSDIEQCFFVQGKGRGKAPLADIVLMQYTGLKDKNGVEIYEGDVVKGYSVYPTASTFKSFLKDEVYYTNRGTWECYSYILGGFNEQVEVIGNIYENPLAEESK